MDVATLPKWTKVKKRLIRGTIALGLRLSTNIELLGLENLRELKGNAIVVSNHLGRMDGLLSFILVPRDDIFLMVAEKYRTFAIGRWIVRELDLLWLERFEADFGTIREVIKRLEAGNILFMAPEGTRSPTESLQEGKQGAAYLAAKSGAKIIPAGLIGTEDRVVAEHFRRFHRPKVKLVFGPSFTVPPLPHSRKEREKFLKAYTEEIMSRIAILLPEKYRGEYANHPRVEQLLSLMV